MPAITATSPDTSRAGALQLAQRLELLTIAWAGTEATLGLWSAWFGHSLSLAAFGFDSLIEMVSAAALVWRLRMENDPRRREAAERVSLRIAAVCLLLLAAYVTVEAVRKLVHHGVEHPTMLGIAITASAVLFMPLLGRAKRRVAMRLNSAAMATDARQADFCALQSLLVLLSLLAAHWWHIPGTDSIAALLLVPLIVREGVRALQGKSCCGSGASCC